MSQRIIWQSKNVELPQLDYKHLEEWIERVAASHNRILGNLTYIFCDDEYILEVNKQYLEHDYFTDVITFDYCTRKMLRGDMVISLDTVRTNAEVVGATYNDELLRVIIHGILHLCGIDDKAPGAREIMEGFENQALSIY
jgi:rRNA maturation RNase YbeY